MKTLITFVLFCFGISAVSAQTTDRKIAEIKTHYNEVENRIDNFEEKEYVDEADETLPWSNYKFWYDTGGELIKAEYSFDEEGFGNRESCYFDAGEIIFIFIEEYEPHWDQDGNASQLVSEERIYFDEGEIFEYLVRKQTEDDMRAITEIPHKKKEWTSADQDKILRCSKLMRKYADLAK